VAKKTDNSSLFPDIAQIDNKATGHKNSSKTNLKQANRIVSWVIGFVVDVLPILVCKLQSILYSSSIEKKTIYDEFLTDFISSGSFLWTSMTLLVMSCVELLFSGFKRKSSSKFKWGAKLFLGAVAIVLVCAIVVYFANIADPYDYSTMKWISWVAFIVFVILSGIVSFGLV